MSVTLYPYQEDAVRAVYADWRAGVQRPALVIPTGGGKTTVFTYIANAVLYATNRRPGPFVILVHIDELVQQAYEAVKRMNPGLKVGIVKASRNEIRGVHGIVASVQSLGRGRAEKIAALDPCLVIVDEAHHYAAKTYRKAMEALGCFNPAGPRVLGVSATLTREDEKGLGEIWEKVAYEVSIQELVDLGFLVMPRGRLVAVEGLSLTGVRKRAGELDGGQLAEAISATPAPEVIAAAYAEQAGDRAGIAFAVNVELSQRQAAAFNELGIKAEHVDGATPLTERRAIVERLRNGTTQVVSNCNVLMEGFDAPNVSAVVTKPTMSATLYRQMVGRGLRRDRKNPRKTDCLVFEMDTGKRRHDLASITHLGLDKPVLMDVDGENLLGGVGDGPGLPEEVVSGAHKVTEFEFFQTLKARPETTPWRQTYKGVWFLQGLVARVVLIRGGVPGTYRVGIMHDSGSSGIIDTGDLELRQAMGHAEQALTDAEGRRPKRRRDHRDPATALQRQMADAMGLRYGPDITVGEMQHLMQIHHASVQLDRLELARNVTQGGYWN